MILISRASLYKNNFYYKFFNFVVLIILISLILFFSSSNIFLFYLFFELRLIPVLLLILGWGYQPERLQAGLYLFFYTLLASLPILVSIFILYENFFTLRFEILKFINIKSGYLFIFICSVFFVKIPIFFLHLWLPKAHVEAPVSGSIILAGVILKLGGYGLIRVLPIFTLLIQKISILFSISLVGGVIVSFICIRQRDIKSLVAYSSVSHIGIVLAGLLTFNR